MRTFLLADDDQDDKDEFCEALMEIDPTLICYPASDGEEVIIKLGSGAFKLPDMIFLDINMPGMNGWDCLAYLKGHASYLHIPVIIYSTSSHRKERDKALDMGALGFFTKPTEYSKLKDILSFLVSRSEENISGVTAYLNGL